MLGDDEEGDGELDGDEERRPIAFDKRQAKKGKLAAPRMEASET
jgi:hypothetical protein